MPPITRLACIIGTLINATTAVVSMASTDLFFNENFDTPAALPTIWSGGQIVTEPNGSGQALKIVNTNPSGWQYMYATLPLSSVAGRRIVVKAQVKASAVSVPPNSWNGIKVMLVCQSPGGTSYPQASISTGTFDWTNATVTFAVPANATSVKVQLGLENSTGTVWFDNVRVEANPAVFVESFDYPTSVASTWSGVAYTLVANGSGNAIKITSGTPGSNVLSATLPLEGLKGHRVLVTGKVKGVSISSKPNPWNGIKMMLAYTMVDGSTFYPQIDQAVGSFDWQNVYMVVNVPSNVIAVQLFLGLEMVTGTVYFDDISVQANPVCFAEDFDSGGVNARWSGAYSLVTGSSTARQALQITNQAAGGSVYATTDLQPETIRGKRVILSARVCGTGISSKPNPWNGVKVMLSYTSPSRGTQYLQPTYGTGTFGSTPAFLILSVPDDVTSARLYLGLENVTGTAVFDDIYLANIDNSVPGWSNPTPNYTGHTNSRLRGMMVSTSLQISDIPTLKAWNVNLVRWQLGGTAYPNGLNTANYPSVLNTEITKLDAILPTLQQNGIIVNLDLHSLSFHEFDSKANQDLLISTWKTLAGHYKNDARIWAFDIANEPDDTLWQPSLLTWNELAERVAIGIREVEASKTIIVESLGARPGAMTDLRPVRTSNVVYSIHSYDPGEYTQQGVSGSGFTTTCNYPGLINGVYWDINQQALNMAATRAFQSQYGTSIYVGEFSAARWAPGACQYLSDSINLFEGYGWDWSYHAFREWDGWNLELPDSHDMTPPASPTDRLQLFMLKMLPNTSPF